MHLNEEEKQMLQGDCGPTVQKAMEILVKLGETHNAPHMIEITSAHIDGNIDKEHNEDSIAFIEQLAADQVQVRTFTTLNTIGLDREMYQKLGFNKEQLNNQFRLNAAYEKINCLGAYTCTPYYTSNLPRFGDHVAWSESSTPPFVNAVLGARTSREAGVSALMAAITGRTPYYSYHVPKNRLGDVLVKVDCKIRDISDYGLLGYFVGKRVGSLVPVFDGLLNASRDDMIYLGASLATSGSVGMYHIPGVTPEARNLDDAFGSKEPELVLNVTQSDLQEPLGYLNDMPEGPVEFVSLGCPHYSLAQLIKVAELLEGKKVHKQVTLWIHTSETIRHIARKIGIEAKLERAGALLTADMCTICSPLEKLGFRTLVTDSVKQAFYSHLFNKFTTAVDTTENVINVAVAGTWKRKK
jgi:phosphomecalonate degydratase large subunit